MFNILLWRMFNATIILRMKTSIPRSLILLAGVLLACFVTMSVQAQDWAKARLEASPRHREYVALRHGNRTLQAFVVYPEIKDKAPVVILIHEIFGLSDWAKEMADELAAQGFIVVAPDLLSGFGPGGGGSSEFPSTDATVKAVSGLDPDGVNADLDAAADYAKRIPAGNGKIATVGFCWGGSKSFAFAAHRKDLSAAFVFYGQGPADVTTITAPVYGFYAGNDARIGATVPATVEAMKAAGKKYDPVTYDGAGHGFMRAGEDPTNTVPGNKTAREQGFSRLVTLLKTMKSAHAASNPGPEKSGTEKSANAAPACHDDGKQTEAAKL
jgi:carboxymethylenebutenolidase